MKEYVVRAPAKVNLSLDVIGKRPDGYHEMRMVNHSVTLSDILVFKENGQRIAVSCSDPKIPTDARNLVHRVAEKLQARFGIDGESRSTSRRTFQVKRDWLAAAPTRRQPFWA